MLLGFFELPLELCPFLLDLLVEFFQAFLLLLYSPELRNLCNQIHFMLSPPPVQSIPILLSLSLPLSLCRSLARDCIPADCRADEESSREHMVHSWVDRTCVVD